MPRNASGIFSPVPGTDAIANQTIGSSPYNSRWADVVADLNAARPITSGGTGATNAADARNNLGVTLATLGAQNATTTGRVLLLRTVVASAVSSVAFTDFDTLGYSAYEIVLEGVRGSLSAILRGRCYNASGLITGASAYNYSLIYNSGVRGTSNAGPTGGTNYGSAASFQISGNAGNNIGTGSIDGRAEFLNVAGSAYKPAFWSTLSSDDGTGFVQTLGAGHCVVNSPLTGVDFLMSSGSIAAGEFSLYGIK